MGKSKPRKPPHHAPSTPYSKPSKSPQSQSKSKSKPPPSTNPAAPTIPFDPSSRILLVGEGDFSFSASLLEHHSCISLVATSYDTRSGLVEKYPQAATNVAVLESEDGCAVLCGVDATKLGKGGVGGGGKEVRKGGWDGVVFNFPHVGGVTKDVNRQVRLNQELLVGFFKSALPLLANDGSIIVTLFEGEPYDLWNIRDLARHVGLRVERSFRFQAGAYPGYKHARTLGNIDGGGGWKGEDRPARTYVFKTKDGWEQPAPKKKRTIGDSDSESA